MNVTLSPKVVLKFLLSSVAILLVANLVVIVTYAVFDSTVGGWLPEMFFFDSEQNIPTFYSAFNLMVSALLLLLIAMKHKGIGSDWLFWLGLAFLMCFLSVDEATSIHEQLGAPTRAMLDMSATFYYAWVLPYLLAVAAIFLLYFKFLMRLPKRTRVLFLLSGSLFVLGAAGFEVFGNTLKVIYPRTYNISITLEELLEMLGVVCFIYSLMDYATNRFGGLTITIASRPSRYRRTLEKLNTD